MRLKSCGYVIECAGEYVKISESGNEKLLDDSATIAKVLIEPGIDIHSNNSSRCTALDLALLYGHTGIEESLNEAGKSTDEERDSSFEP